MQRGRVYLLIAALILVLVAGVTAWYWPDNAASGPVAVKDDDAEKQPASQAPETSKTAISTSTDENPDYILRTGECPAEDAGVQPDPRHVEALAEKRGVTFKDIDVVDFPEIPDKGFQLVESPHLQISFKTPTFRANGGRWEGVRHEWIGDLNLEKWRNERLPGGATPHDGETIMLAAGMPGSGVFKGLLAAASKGGSESTTDTFCSDIVRSLEDVTKGLANALRVHYPNGGVVYYFPEHFSYYGDAVRGSAAFFYTTSHFPVSQQPNKDTSGAYHFVIHTWLGHDLDVIVRSLEFNPWIRDSY